MQRSATLARAVQALAAAALLWASGGIAAAQALKEVRIARQAGLGYFPIAVMEEQKLLEKHTKAAGLGEIRSVPVPLGTAAGISEQLLSGSVEVVGGGLTPLLILWDKTRGGQKVRGIAAISAAVIYLNTINPAVRTLKDFTAQDRIAVSAVGLSIHAIILKMAAEQAFGAGQETRLDALTISMTNSDATAAMLRGRSDILTASFSAPPFQTMQLRDPKVRRILSSTDVLGGLMPGGFLYTTQKTHESNPLLFKAMVAALEEACAWITADIRRAAAAYIAAERVNMTADAVVELMTNGETVFTVVPENTRRIADFMTRIGQLKARADSWKDYFFADIHEKAGS